VDKHGRVPWFAGAFTVAALGAVAGAIVIGPMGMRGWQPLLACGLVMGLGSSVTGLGVYLYTPELYPTRMRAWATATGSSLNRLGSFIAPSVVGWMLAEYDALALVFAMLAVVASFGAVVVWTLGEETKRTTLETLSP
jgi:putative MFS transporter